MNHLHGWMLTAVVLCAACGSQESQTTPTEIPCAGAALATGPWYPTVAPSEHGNDSRRTHTYAAACSTVSAAQPGFELARATDLPGLYNMVTRKPGEVFALGGSFGRIDETNGPYVVRVDSRTLQTLWRTRLPVITAADWNYPGAMAVHANGDLYAIYGHHLARLDADSGEVKVHVVLPVNQSASDVAYNGFSLLSDGRIVAKSIHRLPGCAAPDFKAFLSCETRGVAASTIVLIDPQTLKVEQTLIAPEHIRFRVTVARLDGTEYVYMPGEERIRRYRYADGHLQPDNNWSAAYRQQGQMPGTAVAALGDWIVIQTNGIPATAPLSIVAISQRDAVKQFRIEPFRDSPVAGSFIPSLPTVDEDNRRVYTFDGFAGEVAALDFSEMNGFTTAWKARQRSFAFSALVGPPAARVLVSTDLDAFLPRMVFEHLSPALRSRVMQLNLAPPKEAVVWREAASGHELARSGAVAAVAGSVPTPGHYGWLFVPDLNDEALLRFSPAQP